MTDIVDRQNETSIVDPALAYRATFVGRDRELAALHRAAISVAAGEGGLALVSGDPGIGKTSLVERFGRELAASAWLRLIGHCADDGALTRPYLPVIEAIRQLPGLIDIGLAREAAGVHARALARVMPEFADTAEEPPRHDALVDERILLMEALHALLSGAAVEQPLLLVLEDLHRADRGTLDVLRYLTRRVSNHRILILGTYREVEVEAGGPHAAALTEMGGEPVRTHFALGGISRGAVGQMLAAIAEQDVADTLVTMIFDESQGNPLFVRELVRLLAEEQLLERRDGTLEAVPAAPRRMPLPPSLSDVLRERVARLGPECERVLEAASVIGREFEFELLADVTEIERNAIEPMVEAALRAGLLEDRSELGLIRWRFTHALMTRALYDRIAAPRRARLHVSIARALERRHPERIEELAAELARHYSFSSNAEDLGRAVHHAVLAAAHAVAVHDDGQAVQLLELAIAVHESFDGSDAVAAELKVRLAASLAAVGQATRAYTEAAEDAFRRAERAERGDLALAAAMAAIDAIRASSEQGRWAAPSTFEWIGRLGRYARPGTAEYVVFLIMESLRVAIVSGDREMRWRAVDEARAFGDPALLIRAADRLLSFSGGPELEERRRALAEEVSRIEIPVRDDGGVFGRFSSMLEFGDRARAEAYLAEAETWAKRTNYVEHEAAVRTMRMVLDYMDGHLARVRSEFLAHVDDDVGSGARLRVTALRAFLVAGIYEPRIDFVANQPLHVLFRNGPTTDTRDHLAQAVEQSGVASLHYVEELEVANAVGDADLIRLKLASASGMAAPSTGALFPTLIKRHLALGYARLGKPEQAKQLYMDALDDGAGLRFRTEIALVRLELGELLLDHYSDERDSARDHLEFALAECEDMGLAPYVERARQQLSRLPAAAAHAVADGNDAGGGLSPREIEVLRLAARGMTNRQIAEALVITEGTAANHLHHIMTKTNTASRTEAAAWGMRTGVLRSDDL